MSGQPSYTETIKLERQLADIQSQLTQRAAELEAATRRATNAQWQVDFLLGEAKKAFGLTDEYTPADLVDCVLRPAASMLKERDALKAELERVRALIKALPKVEGEIRVAAVMHPNHFDEWHISAGDTWIMTLAGKQSADSVLCALQHRQGMEG